MNPEINNSIEEEEVIERFPEVKKIEDRQLRLETIKTIEEYCPDYFWKVPGSSSGKYHPEDHREEKGLWLHTKRAFTEYERLAPSWNQLGRVTKEEIDYGRSAILLHDMFKYGWPKQRHTTKNHDVVAANILQENTDLPKEVIGCIESHNGPWYKGKSPENDLELLHHTADMGASDVNNPDIAVLNPSKELEKQFPNVNKIDE